MSLAQGLLFWLFKGGFKVSLGTYISSESADVDNFETASPVHSLRTGFPGVLCGQIRSRGPEEQPRPFDALGCEPGYPELETPARAMEEIKMLELQTTPVLEGI